MAEQTAPKSSFLDHPPLLLMMVAITLFGSLGSMIYFSLLRPHFGVYEAIFVGMDLAKIIGVAMILMRSSKGWITYTIAEIFRCALIPLVIASQNAHTEFGMESPFGGKSSLILFFSVIFGLIWIMGYGYLLKESAPTLPSEKQ